jgi:hypothetical protein
VKLVKCATCGQSINRRRDTCPFCGAVVVKGAPTLSTALPTSVPSVEAATHSEKGAEKPGVADGKWWKRPNIVIPAVLGVVAVVVLLVVAVSVISTQSAHRRAAADAARAAAAQRASASKEATAAAVRPFVELEAALKVGIVFLDYTKRVQAVQYAVDTYSPPDAQGKSIKAHLAKAASFYAAALDSWNSEIQGGYAGNKQAAWTSASAEVQLAKTLADGQ